MSGSRALLLAVVLAGMGLAGTALAQSAEDRILPPDQYTTDKGRTLARTHARALRALNEDIYHCLPWLETQKASIGFFRPKHIQQDDRYLSVRVFIEQDPSPQFASLNVQRRASAMYSRYVGVLLRKMAQDPALVRDTSVDGFTVILEWLKQEARGASDRPVHETIAIFIPRAEALEYLAARLDTERLAQRVRVLGFDGETALGELKLNGWEDSFATTYKVANYQVAQGVTCR